MIKISIVTVVYNAADTLEETILSVSTQRYPNIEHIVIDGGSTDGSIEIIKKHSDKVDIWISEPDEGIYHGMNKGIAMATGAVIGTLNADDVYQDNHVLDRIAGTFADEDIEGCYGDLVYVDPDDLSKVIRYWTSEPYRPGLFERGWMPAHPTFFVRSTVYERFGVFNLQLKLQSDFELTARLMALHQISTKYIPKVLVRMRTGGATNKSWKNILRGNLESYRACKKMGLKLTPFYFFTKMMMRVPQYFRTTPTYDDEKST